MIVKKIFFKIFQLLLNTLLFASCTSINTSITTQSAPSLTSSIPRQTETRTPSPTMTPTFTLTPTQTNTLTPTITFTPSSTPIPYGKEPITAENIGNLVQLSKWGKGAISELIWLETSQSWIVGTPLGVYIYSGDSLEEIAFFEGAEQFSISLDKQKIALRYQNFQIKVANILDGQLENEFSFEVKIPWYQQDWVNSLPNAQRESQKNQILGYLSNFSASAFSLDNKFLAISFGDNHCWVWDLENNLLIADLYHDLVSNVSQMAFSPSNLNLLMTNTFREKSEVSFWSIPEEKLIWNKVSAGHIVGNPFSPDGSLVTLELTYSYSKDASVLIWQTEYGNEIGRVSGRVASNPFSPNGDYLVTTSYSQVKLWAIPGVYQHKIIETGLDWPKAVFIEEGQFVSVNNRQQVWGIDDLLKFPELEFDSPPSPPVNEVKNQLLRQGHFSLLENIFFLPDRQFRILGVDGNIAYWWDGPSTAVISFNMFSEPYTDINNESFSTPPIFSDVGDMFFYCYDGKLFGLNIETMISVDIMRCNDRSILAYSNELGVIAKGDRTNLDFFDLSSGQVIHSMQGHRKSITVMEFSDDGELFASGSTEFQGFGEIVLWDTKPPSRLMYEDNRPYGVSEIVFSADNQWMATYSGGYIQIWSVPEQKLFSNISGIGTSLAFSPASNLLASAGYDGKIYFYQVPSADLIFVIDGHLRYISDLIFTEDGFGLFSISHDGSIKLWGIE